MYLNIKDARSARGAKRRLCPLLLKLPTRVSGDRFVVSKSLELVRVLLLVFWLGHELVCLTPYLDGLIGSNCGDHHPSP
jgi:hypothetical protein